MPLIHWVIKKFSLLLLLLLFGNVQQVFSFQGSGTCQSVLSDYISLSGKSAFLDGSLSGNCIVNNEKDFPKIFKHSAYLFTETKDIVSVKLRPEKKEIIKVWTPKKRMFKVKFLFVNYQSLLDCGIRLDDVIGSFFNLNLNMSIGGSVGCPALDYDGSFRFVGDISLTDKWRYSQGAESKRTITEITSTTGAVSTQYEYYTTGFTLDIIQTETSLNYHLIYIGKNGNKTENIGEVVNKIILDVWDDYTEVRKFLFIPLGVERKRDTFKLYLEIKEAGK